MGLALVFWGGTVFAQEPANSRAQVALSGNGTEMADYCRSAGGMGGMMNGTTAVAGANLTEMQNYCQNAGGMMGSGNMTGHGGMMGGGMMGR